MERKQRISVRLSDEELNIINQNTEKSGFKTASEYIREIATSEVKTVFYDSDVNEEIKNMHSEFRRIAEYVHELAVQSSNQGIGATIACNNAERQVLELNSKMKYLTQKLNELKEEKIKQDGNY